MVWWWAREAADAMAFFFLFLQCNQKNAANRCYLVFDSIFSGSNLVFYSISSQPLSLCEAVWTRPQSSPLFGKQNKWKKTHVQQVREKNYGIRWKCSFYRYIAFWHWLNHTVTRTQLNAASHQDIDHGQFVSSAVLFIQHLTFRLLLLSRSHAIQQTCSWCAHHAQCSAAWASQVHCKLHCLHV